MPTHHKVTRLEFSNSNHASSGPEHTRRDSGPHLTLQQQFQSKNAVITLKKCGHPKAKLETDPVTNATWCHECALEMPRKVSLISVGSEKFGRSPTNRAVVGGNKGSSSEGLAINEAVKAVQGSYGSEPMQRITKTCPECKTQQSLNVVGPSVACEKCGIELAHYIARWLPQNNGDRKGEANQSMRFLADKRLLEIWTPPEGNPVIRMAQELFSKRMRGKLNDENADRLASLYLKNVRRRLPKKRDLDTILDATLEAARVELK